MNERDPIQPLPASTDTTTPLQEAPILSQMSQPTLESSEAMGVSQVTPISSSTLPPLPITPMMPMTAPLANPQPAKKGIPFLVLLVIILLGVGLLGYVAFVQFGKGLAGRGAPATSSSTTKPVGSAAPAFNTRTAPNPACNKSCQTSLDCEAGSGGTAVMLDCVKEEGATTGVCRNPSCSSVPNCMCQ